MFAVILLECLASLLEVTHVAGWTLSAICLEDLLVHRAVGTVVVLRRALHALVIWKAIAWSLAALPPAPGDRPLGEFVLGAPPTFAAAMI